MPAAAETLPQPPSPSFDELLQEVKEQIEEQNTQREYEKEAKLAASRTPLGRKPKDNIREMFPANTVSLEHICNN